MKANPDKSHLLVSDKNIHSANIDGTLVKNSHKQKLLGVTIDSELKFDSHVQNICTKVSQKLSALYRIATYMSLNKRRIVLKSFITSNFNYCPLVWMFHSRKLNNTINRLHERALRIVYKDYHTTFENLLLIDKSVSIHNRNLQQLAIEIFKFKCGLSPEIMNMVFESVEEPYPLRNATGLRRGEARTVLYGTQTIRFIAPKVWQMIPQEIKNSNSLKSFRDKIKSWKAIDCPCRLCKQYVAQIGFL